MNAMKLPSRERIKHPGAATQQRRSFVRGHAHSTYFRFKSGQTVAEAVALSMNELGIDFAAVVLDGLVLSSGSYVTPSGPRDIHHVAWYSEQILFKQIRLEHGTAMVGQKEGKWFLHCHAVWHDNAQHIYEGHMLCDQLVIAEDFDVEVIAFVGGGFEATLDTETNFTLFQLKKLHFSEDNSLNATLLTIRPHEDLRGTIDAIASELDIQNARILGLGSIIGAEFYDAPPMRSALSEILLRSDAIIENGKCSFLPLICVDDQRIVYIGDLKTGHGPVLMTAELLLVGI